MATFKLPQNELSKLRRYKKKLLEQQRKLDRGEIEDISIHKSITKSSGISQILKALEPKGENIGTDFKGAITTASGRRLPLSEPIYEKKEPTRQSFADAFKIASEYDISTKGLKQPKEEKPEEEKPLTVTKSRERIELRKYIRDFDKQKGLSLSYEWNSDDDTLVNLQRVTDTIDDEGMKLEFIRGAERAEEKKPTKVQAMKRITTLEKAKIQLESTGALSELVETIFKGFEPKVVKEIEGALEKADTSAALEAIERELEYYRPFAGEGIPEGAKPTGKYSQGKPVYVLPDGRGWIPD